MSTKRPTRLDYCQYLLVSQINYTITNYAEHTPKQMSHDAINRYLREDRLTSRLVWEHARGQIQASVHGFVIFDDTVLDKNFSHKIELVRLQYSGNAHRLIKGIGLVNCVYVNPETGQYWVIDYRIYDPDHDGKSKLDHVQDMLTQIVQHKQLPFYAVLMDTWYATKDLMLFIDSLQKIYYCPLKDNRQVDDSGGAEPYRRVDELAWTNHAWAHGKVIKIKGFPKDHKVKLFRVAVATNRTDWIVTNDHAQDSDNAVQEVCGMRWKIEQFHRELKQTTGIEKNQCRKARIQRNHIACAMLVWIRLTDLARQTQQTIYCIKHGLLDNYLCQQLRNPSVKMRFA
jgi:hypothetical protein